MYVNEIGLRMWDGFMWYRTGINGARLWTRQWNAGSQRKAAAGLLLPPHVGLCSLINVYKLSHYLLEAVFVLQIERARERWGKKEGGTPIRSFAIGQISFPILLIILTSIDPFLRRFERIDFLYIGHTFCDYTRIMMDVAHCLRYRSIGLYDVSKFGASGVTSTVSKWFIVTRLNCGGTVVSVLVYHSNDPKSHHNNLRIKNKNIRTCQ
jgi:hypothetical protein